MRSAHFTHRARAVRTLYIAHAQCALYTSRMRSAHFIHRACAVRTLHIAHAQCALYTSRTRSAHFTHRARAVRTLHIAHAQCALYTSRMRRACHKYHQCYSYHVNHQLTSRISVGVRTYLVIIYPSEDVKWGWEVRNGKWRMGGE